MFRCWFYMLDLYSVLLLYYYLFFFFSSRRRHTRFSRDWSSDVCSSDLLHLDLRILHHLQPLALDGEDHDEGHVAGGAGHLHREAIVDVVEHADLAALEVPPTDGAVVIAGTVLDELDDAHPGAQCTPSVSGVPRCKRSRLDRPARSAGCRPAAPSDPRLRDGCPGPRPPGGR